MRESLNVESGLNDGICVPVLLLLLALLTEAHSTMPFALAGYFFLEELGIGVLTGAALALLVGGLLRLSQRHCLQIEAWQQLVMPALALLSFASAQALGGQRFYRRVLCRAADRLPVQTGNPAVDRHRRVMR